MSRLLVSILCLLAVLFAPLQAAKSAERTYVSLLTCSPGDEVYAYFGHTALRYCNPDKNLDLVFNYGVFDFSEPGFVAKFVLGETDYMLGVIDYPYFIQEYAMRGSGVVEQVLAFDSLQCERLFSLLRDNYRPANRVYRYNYFYNNCTTKARDIIEEALADAGGIEYRGCDGAPTFRETVHRFTAVSPWYSFGIDLLLGSEADDAPGARVLQFIPSTLMRDFSSAVIPAAADSLVPLVQRTNNLLEPANEAEDSFSFFTPNILFALILLLVTMLTYIGYRKGRLFWAVDVVLLLVQGVAGALVTFMVLFSVHPTVGSNLLVLLLNPLPLVLLPIFIYNAIKKRKLNIMWMQTIMVAQFLILSPFIPQYIPAAIYMFAVTLLIRSLYITHKRK
jgi:hypothetical protein